MNERGVPGPLDLLAARAAQRPQGIALTHLRAGKPAQSWTWSELLTQTRDAAAAVSRTWPPAAVVPAYAGKSLSLVALMLGTISSGRTFAGVNPKFRAPQVQQVLKACKAQSALTDSAGLPVVRGVVEQSLEKGHLWWWLDSSHAGAGARGIAESLKQKGALLDWQPGGEGSTPEPVECQAQGSFAGDRPAVCLFTSGSTGVPKGVLVSWQDLFNRAEAECELFALTEQDVLLSLLPFSFDVGLNQLLSSIVCGAQLVILDSWLPLDILKAIEQYGVSGVSGVPSIWVSLLRTPLKKDPEGAHGAWRYLTVSGGSMTPDQLSDLAVRVPGVGIFKTYGQTESFRSTALRPDELHTHPASVGRAFGSARVYVVREDGSSALPHELGEVVHTGLGVMTGYLNAPPESQKRRSNPFHGAVDPAPFAIFTGDHGYLDAEGFLYLVGRQDDMVKIAGNRVHLSEVASQAASMAEVLTAEAVVVSQPNDDPAIVVFAILRAQEAQVDASLLRLQLCQRLPTYMHPARVEILESFPLTASGKADRPLLKTQAENLFSKQKSQTPVHS